MKLHFLYGTETGSAEMLCEDIEEDLGGGFDCTITAMGEVDPQTLDADTVYLFVTSTYGNGDLPSMAMPFYEALDAAKPDLSHVRFGVFGLGDMVFSATYNQGSERLMEKLVERGAKMVGDRGLHDASTPDLPEDLAIPWAHDVVAQLNATAA